MSVVRKCLRTVLPNEPVPPVIIRVALVKADINYHHSQYELHHYNICRFVVLCLLLATLYKYTQQTQRKTKREIYNTTYHYFS